MSRESRVTIHMAASLDGYIARSDGRIDWMETHDEFAAGETLDPAYISAFLASIDCYVMGSNTYLTALDFEARGLGWVYGDKPVFVMTRRDLPRSRPTVSFHADDLEEFFSQRLRPNFREIWVAGGGRLAGACVRAGIADEIRYSILPVLIGRGIGFFDGLENDVQLHLLESKAYANGTIALRHEVRRQRR